jgi:hypothetical protein
MNLLPRLLFISLIALASRAVATPIYSLNFAFAQDNWEYSYSVRGFDDANNTVPVRFYFNDVMMGYGGQTSVNSVIPLTLPAWLHFGTNDFHATIYAYHEGPIVAEFDRVFELAEPTGQQPITASGFSVPDTGPGLTLAAALTVLAIAARIREARVSQL